QDTLKSLGIIRFFDGAVATTTFKIMYLLLTLASFNSVTANRSYLTIGSIAVVALGFLILFARICNFKNYRSMPFLAILALFLVSYAISALAAARYGLLSSAQGFIWMAMQFFVLYVTDARRSRTSLDKEMGIILGTLTVYTFICTFIGLIMALIGYQGGYMFDGFVNILGLSYGRLWGVYSDPNYGCVFSLASVFFLLWFYIRNPKKSIRILLIIDLVMQVSYVALSASRTGLIGGALAFAVLTFCYFPKWKKIAEKKMAIRVSASILASALVAALFVGSIVGIGFLYNSLATPIQERFFPNISYTVRVIQPAIEAANSDPEAEEKIATEKSTGESDVSATADAYAGSTIDYGIVARDEALENDKSNNRFSIWQSSIEIFKSAPVIGVSHRNMMQYAQENLPETFVVREGFTTFHNVFFDVLPSQGIVGMLIFLVLVISVFKRLFKGLARFKGRDYFCFAALFAVMSSIAFSALVYSEILYINTVGSVLFWIILGYLVSITKRDDHEQNVRSRH
ncbi:MAG: hypothetical protein HGA54_06975, partial [Actinobacteria bacterium]|nr:hypothetical protein [Actinomycetota bacterium]